LEQSDYTSIQERILEPKNTCLRPFADHDDGIPFGLSDYLELVGWAGRENQPTHAALAPVSMLRAFAQSLGQYFVKGQAPGKQL